MIWLGIAAVVLLLLGLWHIARAGFFSQLPPQD